MNPSFPRQVAVSHLGAARLVGSCAVCGVAQLAVDMPEGYFGAADKITAFGLTYLVLLLSCSAVAIVAQLSHKRWGATLAAVIYAVNIGVFLPPMTSVPLTAGLVFIWNGYLLVQHLFPLPSAPISEVQPPLLPGEESFLLWLRGWGPAVRHLGLVVVFLTVAEAGYGLSGNPFARYVCLAVNLVSLAMGSGYYLTRVRRRRIALALLVAAWGLLGALGVWLPQVGLTLLVVWNLVLLGGLARQGTTWKELIDSFFLHPARLIILTFLAVILVGTLILTFPSASSTGGAISPLDALFTATSATCVTGLIVRDTPHDFSLLGQVTILGLIQVGGLGIIVLSTFGMLLIGQHLSLRGERALGESLDIRSARGAYRLARFIVLSTLAIEGVGAVLLAYRFAVQGHGWSDSAWRGLFHSISAFCNAGFALQSDSLLLFQQDPFALLVLGGLIVLGGVGFIVLASLGRTIKRSAKRPLDLQVKAVLTATAILVLSGWAFFAAVEWNHSLAPLGPVDKMVNALFQSITPRTAGFNSVGMEDLSPATVVIFILLMFVGASPGSTGGGIKTTTAMVLLASIRSVVQGKSEAVLFRRRLAPDLVYRSLAILVVAGLVTGTGLVVLLLVESQPLEWLLFEAVSAVGTVGLSLGATPVLSATGKLVVIVLMFAGRVGPLTLALLLAYRKVSQIGYPGGTMMVG